MRGETERPDVRHQWRRENQDRQKTHEKRHLTSECARSLLVSSCCRHTHSLHTKSCGSSCPRVCTHLIHAWSERHSSTLSSPFHPTSYSSYSPSISSSSCCLSTSTRIRSNTVYSANKEMGSIDESYSNTGCEPKRVISSPSQGPWPSNSSPSNGSSRMWITMTPRSRRCLITHTEYMSITPREKACLLVSRRRPCPKEPGDPLLKEHKNLLWKEVRS